MNRTNFCNSRFSGNSFLLLGIALLCLPFFSTASPNKPIGAPIELHDEHHSTGRYMELQLKGILRLTGDKHLAELSDLAWDADEKRLYGITDQGRLLHMHPQFNNDTLTGMELSYATNLTNLKGKRLKGRNRDAEGLTVLNGNNGIKGDSQLLISFERHHRVMRYDIQGNAIERLKVSSSFLKSILQMDDNKGMEGLTLHPEFGLISAAERPPFRQQDNYLFSNKGGRWLFTPLESSGALVALETLPSGDLIILERAYTSPFHPWIISLARVPYKQLKEQQRIVPEIIAQFDSSKGWRTLNFEGLTRHLGNHYFIASDDNDQPYADTQIIYFEWAPN